MKSFITKHKKITGLSVFLFWLIIWQILSVKIGETLLLPSPVEVVIALFGMMQTSLFWKSVLFSLLRILLGVILGITVGFIFAFITETFILADRLFSPLLHIIRTVPVASFIILALVWIKIDIIPIVISFLMVFPLVWENIRVGIRSIRSDLLEMASVFQVKRKTTFVKIIFPSLLPYLLSSCATGLGFGWKSGIAAEVICHPLLSIGKQLQDAKIYLDTPEVFAWTATVVFLSILLERMLHYSMKAYHRYLHIKTEKTSCP